MHLKKKVIFRVRRHFLLFSTRTFLMVFDIFFSLFLLNTFGFHALCLLRTLTIPSLPFWHSFSFSPILKYQNTPFIQLYYLSLCTLKWFPVFESIVSISHKCWRSALRGPGLPGSQAKVLLGDCQEIGT